MVGHLEYQEHPGDAEANEAAIGEVAHPHVSELQDCYQKGRRVSKSMEAQDGSTLRINDISLV